MLSSYCERIRQKYNISNGKVGKFVPTSSTKTKYAPRYRNLQLYMDLGLKLEKVRRAFPFKQSAWLKYYTDYKETNSCQIMI